MNDLCLANTDITPTETEKQMLLRLRTLDADRRGVVQLLVDYFFDTATAEHKADMRQKLSLVTE